MYISTYIYSKIATNIIMGFKMLCQVGRRDQKLKNYSRYVTLKTIYLNVGFLI